MGISLQPDTANARISRNVDKMAAQGASAPEIEQYIQLEGVQPGHQSADPQLHKDITDLRNKVESTSTAGVRHPVQASTYPGQDFGSRLESGIASVARGITLGSNDEILGGVSAAGKLLTGDTNVRQNYRAARDAIRAHDQTAQAAHPNITIAGQLAGGFAPLIATGGASSGVGLANVLKQGALYGALQGAGDAKELSDIPKDAAIGGGIGALGGAVLHGAGKGLGVIANKSGLSDFVANQAGNLAERVAPGGKLADLLQAVQASTGKAGGANKTITEGLANEGQSPASVLSTLRRNVASSGEKPEILGDYSPETLRTTKALTKAPGDARAKIVKVIQDRNANTRGRVLQDFTQGGRSVAADPAAAMSPDLPTQLPDLPARPVRPVDPSSGVRDRLAARFQALTGAGSTDVRQAAEGEVRDRAASAAQLFPDAYQGSATLDTPEAHDLMSRPVMKTLWQRAQTAAANRGETLPTTTERTLTDDAKTLLAQAQPEHRAVLEQRLLEHPSTSTTIERPVPNVRAMHYMDIALRDAQRGFEGSSGIARGDAATARGLMDQLRGQLGQQDPSLGEAMGDYARRSQSVRAYQQGLNFFKNITSAKAPEGATGAGDPLALKAFRTGLDGLESAVQNMAPEDVPRFRQAAQSAMLSKLRGVSPAESGSTSSVLRSVIGEGPDAQRWQRLLFESPEQLGEFQSAVNGERQGLQAFRGAKDQYRNDVQGYRTAASARRAEEKLVSRAQAGDPDAETTLASRLPDGGQNTLRRLGQAKKVTQINTVPAPLGGSTNSVLSRAFPDAPASESALRQLFPDNASFDTFQSALDRERGMAGTSAKLGGSDTAENLSDAEARKVTSVLSHLLHPVRGIRAAGAAIDKASTAKANSALGDRLSTSGSQQLESVLAELLSYTKGAAGKARVGNAVRNTAATRAAGGSD